MTVSQATFRPEAVGESYRRKHDPVLASTIIYAGSAYVLDANGYAKPASAATGLVARGIAQHTVDNSSGDSGDLFVEGLSGVFAFNMKSGDEPTIANIGDVVYFTDADEVGATSTGRSVAGVLELIENSQAYVHVGLWPLQVGLLAANNLSDVTAATARANIGANQACFTVKVSDLVGANARREGFVAPFALTITKIYSVLEGHALATGDATLTAKIAGSAVTSGVVTITQASSAIGDVDSATPSAANTATAGEFVEVLVGGTNDDTDAQASVTFVCTY